MNVYQVSKTPTIRLTVHTMLVYQLNTILIMNSFNSYTIECMIGHINNIIFTSCNHQLMGLGQHPPRRFLMASLTHRVGGIFRENVNEYVQNKH